MNLKHELKGLAIAILYTCYSLMLGIFMYAYFAGEMQYHLIFDINRYGEATLELIIFLVSIPGCYYLWRENLNIDEVKETN